MRIITRYVLREQLLYFCIALFAFTGILLTLRMLRFASLIVNKGVELGQIGMVFLAIIPTFLEIALPLSALLGVMLAFGRMSGDSEIVVLRASGVSTYQLIFPTLLFALAIAGATLYVSNVLKPWGYRTLSATLFDIARSRSTAGLEPGIFNKLGMVTLYAEEVEPFTGTFREAIIEDRRNPETPLIIIPANGDIQSDPTSQTITLRMNNGTMHEIVEGKYVVTEFRSNTLTLSADEFFQNNQNDRDARARELDNRGIRLELLNISETAHEAPDTEPETLAALGERSRKLRAELYLRSAMPFAAFLLALIALPLGIQQPRMHRTWGAALSLLLGLLIFISYYGVLTIAVTIAESDLIHPLLAVWLPNVLCAILAIFLLNRIGSERWQSVAEGLEILLRSLKYLVDYVTGRRRRVA